MLRRQRLLGASLLGLSALGCARATPVDTATEERAINAVGEREIRAFSTGAVDSLLAVLATDAVMMPPNEPMLTGAEAIRAWHQNIANQLSVEGRYTDSEVSVLGDWAVERYDGVLRFTPKAGGPPVEQQLKGLHVYGDSQTVAGGSRRTFGMPMHRHPPPRRPDRRASSRRPRAWA